MPKYKVIKTVIETSTTEVSERDIVDGEPNHSTPETAIMAAKEFSKEDWTVVEEITTVRYMAVEVSE